MAPLGQWVYFATGVDSIVGQHYGYRYYTNGTTTPFQLLKSRTGNFYSLNNTNTTFYLGGVPSNYPDDMFASSFCTMQHVRLFLDYIPKTGDEFLNIALMEPGSNKIFIRYILITSLSQQGPLNLFFFTSHVAVNNNQTSIVQSFQGSSQRTAGSLTFTVEGFGDPIQTDYLGFKGCFIYLKLRKFI